MCLQSSEWYGDGDNNTNDKTAIVLSLIRCTSHHQQGHEGNNTWFQQNRDRPKVVFPITAVTKSGTISQQSVSAVTETVPKVNSHLWSKPKVSGGTFDIT